MFDVIFKNRKAKNVFVPIYASAFRTFSKVPRSAGVMDMPEIPEDFVPVMRFTITSDVHIGETGSEKEKERLAKMIKKSYEIAKNDVNYKKLDAICFAGDVTNAGAESTYKVFKEICNENIKEGTLFLPVMGNHDFKTMHEKSREKYAEYFECGPDFNYNVNGLHIIGVSESANGKEYDKDSQKWLDNELKKAVEENPKKPIFVLQHEHITNTVYGSIHWGDDSLISVLKKYPQVIDFSGHSHYPINDPRSIWQGAFTALGTGTLSYFELEVDGFAGKFPEEKEKAAQMYVVETDANGSVLIKSYDLISDSFFGEIRYIEKPWDKSTFAYNVKNRMKKDVNPYFKPKSVLMVKNMPNGETTLNFPRAYDEYIVDNYRIVVKDEKGKYVYEDFAFSDYYFNPMPDKHTVNLGKLESKKKYVATVVAENAYGKRSKPIKATFTAK